MTRSARRLLALSLAVTASVGLPSASTAAPQANPTPASPATAIPASTSTAASPAVELLPARARPGDAVLVSVRAAEGSPRPEGALAGAPLLFSPAPGGWRAVGALPIEAEPGTLSVEVRVGGAPAAAALAVVPGNFPERRLRVSDRFVKPPPPDVQARIEADQAAFVRAFAQPATPALFAGRFAWPRADEVTARYGERRTFNGKKPSRHYGLDLAGGLGAPVAAANGGRVVLVRDCWASGLSVMVFHGAGLFTTYFHLSRARVAEGDAVARGDLLGEVGQSGRVTGPHLHWGVKVGERYVDPESVLRLPLE